MLSKRVQLFFNTHVYWLLLRQNPKTKFCPSFFLSVPTRQRYHWCRKLIEFPKSVRVRWYPFRLNSRYEHGIHIKRLTYEYFLHRMIS